MIDVTKRRCLAADCMTIPSQNFPGEKLPLYCTNCKLEGMTDVVTRRCVGTDCMTRPTQNFPGCKRPLYCFKCKLEGMTDVTKKKCLGVNCRTTSKQNFPGEKKPLYCSKCKLEGMVNVYTKKCLGNRCLTVPTQNFPGEKLPLYCDKCKIKGMVDLYSRCQVAHCSRITSHIASKQIPSYCSDHKIKVRAAAVRVKIEPGIEATSKMTNQVIDQTTQARRTRGTKSTPVATQKKREESVIPKSLSISGHVSVKKKAKTTTTKTSVKTPSNLILLKTSSRKRKHVKTEEDAELLKNDNLHYKEKRMKKDQIAKIKKKKKKKKGKGEMTKTTKINNTNEANETNETNLKKMKKKNKRKKTELDPQLENEQSPWSEGEVDSRQFKEKKFKKDKEKKRKRKDKNEAEKKIAKEMENHSVINLKDLKPTIVEENVNASKDIGKTKKVKKTKKNKNKKENEKNSGKEKTKRDEKRKPSQSTSEINSKNSKFDQKENLKTAKRTKFIATENDNPEQGQMFRQDKQCEFNYDGIENDEDAYDSKRSKGENEGQTPEIDTYLISKIAKIPSVKANVEKKSKKQTIQEEGTKENDKVIGTVLMGEKDKDEAEVIAIDSEVLTTSELKETKETKKKRKEKRKPKKERRKEKQKRKDSPNKNENENDRVKNLQMEEKKNGEEGEKDKKRKKSRKKEKEKRLVKLLVQQIVKSNATNALSLINALIGDNKQQGQLAFIDNATTLQSGGNYPLAANDFNHTPQQQTGLDERRFTNGLLDFQSGVRSTYKIYPPSGEHFHSYPLHPKQSPLLPIPNQSPFLPNRVDQESKSLGFERQNSLQHLQNRPSSQFPNQTQPHPIMPFKNQEIHTNAINHSHHSPSQNQPYGFPYQARTAEKNTSDLRSNYNPMPGGDCSHLDGRNSDHETTRDETRGTNRFDYIHPSREEMMFQPRKRTALEPKFDREMGISHEKSGHEQFRFFKDNSKENFSYEEGNQRRAESGEKRGGRGRYRGRKRRRGRGRGRGR
eukprot:Awhi_evm1s9612